MPEQPFIIAVIFSQKEWRRRNKYYGKTCTKKVSHRVDPYPSLAFFAYELEVSRTTVHNWIKEITRPGDAELKRIEELFECPVGLFPKDSQYAKGQVMVLKDFPKNHIAEPLRSRRKEPYKRGKR